MITRARIVAWDFDGVLNRNIVNGEFHWKQSFDEDIGVPVAEFSAYMFRSGRFDPVLRGERDLKDLVAEWIDLSGCTKTEDQILDYWFSKDALPDAKTLAIFDRARASGYKNIIATNNEARRAAYIEHDMGYGALMDHIFAAGPMKCKKPAAAFFEHIQDTLGAEPQDLLLIDDKVENVRAALALGWQGFHFREGDYDGLERALFGTPTNCV